MRLSPVRVFPDSHSGIDEAGLGPILGPYCAACVTIQYQRPPTLWPRSFPPVPQENLLTVGDSKKIYSPGKIQPLERTVLAFHSHFHRERPQWGLDYFAPYGLTDLLWEQPWYKGLKDLPLPLAPEGPPLPPLEDQLQKEGMALGGLDLVVCPARPFNDLLKDWGNKAKVCQELLSPLVQKALGNSKHIHIDRQGNRHYYSDWLLRLFPDRALQVERESPDCSRYFLENRTVEFLVKGDSRSFEIALASLFAKYSRELCMASFNLYWQKKYPDLRATAGYPQDGQRFLKELAIRQPLPPSIRRLR